VLIGLGGLLGPGYVYAFGALAVLMNIGAYFFSDRIVLRMHGARELEPGELPALQQEVASLAARAGIPKPRLYVIPDPQPNAFATGRNPAHGVVAVTEGILHVLSPRELRGVLAHEIAHIKNRDILVSSIAATVAAAVAWIANIAAWTGGLLGASNDEEEGPSPFATLALAIVAPIAATLIQLGISRSREYLADETGARLAGDPEGLASALATLERGAQAVSARNPSPATASLFIVSPFAGVEGIVSLFSTHPRTAERIRRLRALAEPRRAPGALHAWD
jgi:heat shock protein HtpX